MDGVRLGEYRVLFVFDNMMGSSKTDVEKEGQLIYDASARYQHVGIDIVDVQY